MVRIGTPTAIPIRDRVALKENSSARDEDRNGFHRLNLKQGVHQQESNEED